MVNGLTVLPASNVAANPAGAFACSGRDTQRATSRGIVFCYHSHVELPPVPSETDIKGATASALPYLIYSLATDSFETYFSNPPWTQLIGQPYNEHEGRDCLWLVEQVVEGHLGIDFPKIAAHERLAMIEEEVDWFGPNVEAWGFRRLENHAPYQFGDVLRLTLAPAFPRDVCHTTVFVGRNTMLHFWRGGVVTPTLLDDRYRKRIVDRYRHQDAPQ